MGALARADAGAFGDVVGPVGGRTSNIVVDGNDPKAARGDAGSSARQSFANRKANTCRPSARRT